MLPGGIMAIGFQHWVNELYLDIDNSTIHSDVIENIAQTFLDNPDDASGNPLIKWKPIMF